MKRASILDLPEDLLEEDQPNLSSEPTLGPLVTEVANTLGIAPQELNYWAKEALVPKEVLKWILRVAKRYQLNPLLGQIDWEQNPEGRYEVYIPIDGWIAMIHREPSFKGLTFSQAIETEEGIPIWMECSIYRADLIQPITVREYYAELKTDHPIWMQMPKRMLRHKTLQQCARLAFGISAPKSYRIFPNLDITTNLGATNNHRTNLRQPTDSKNRLKQKLTSSIPFGANAPSAL